mmetsp:Transcript_127930/g.398356  ORF Transcript_127930/g.398356 Transcript_127930/m.398356 type:complete len:211 (-) Transcript_127930:152-784(-)
MRAEVPGDRRRRGPAEQAQRRRPRGARRGRRAHRAGGLPPAAGAERACGGLPAAPGGELPPRQGRQLRGQPEAVQDYRGEHRALRGRLALRDHVHGRGGPRGAPGGLRGGPACVGRLDPGREQAGTEERREPRGGRGGSEQGAGRREGLGRLHVQLHEPRGHRPGRAPAQGPPARGREGGGLCQRLPHGGRRPGRVQGPRPQGVPRVLRG